MSRLPGAPAPITGGSPARLVFWHRAAFSHPGLPQARGPQGWRADGYVANFAQEVVKGQLPRSVEGLNGQGVEQFGRSEAFFSSLHYHLSFPDHVHEFDPDQSALSCLKRFEPQHRSCHPFYCSMVLFDNVVEILHLADSDRGAVLLVVALDSRFIGVTAVDRNGLG